MSINITFNSDSQIFHLTNGSISYIMEIVEQKYLAHRYWGNALTGYQKANQIPMYKKTFAAFPKIEKPEFSLEFLPLEFPHPYQGDYKETAISISRSDGNDMIRLEYKNFQIMDGLYQIPDLPQAREFEGCKAQTLIIQLVDCIFQIQVELFYSIFENNDIIIRSSKITNLGNEPLTLNYLASASLDMYYDNQLLTTMYGSHQKEFQLQRQKLKHGQFKIGTTRGASGPQYVPFIALSQNSSEIIGDVYAMTLIYSGNHSELAELDQYNQLRLQIGLNSEQFAWNLLPSQSFYSPQAVLVFSSNGFNGMSQQLHNFTHKHLIHPNFRECIAPILINSWEMTYYNVNETQILSLIDKASQLGFEAVILDDGWFFGRHNSKSSLGDWVVDPQKFPNDLFPIIKKAHKNGLKFGIWFEPEMISADSILATKHPDWIMQSENYKPLYSRNQYILDITQEVVQNFIIQTLSNFIKTYQIDYIKWDMNRHITEPFSQIKSNQHPKAFSHQYMLGLYRIIDKLTNNFPQVLFENCSSGGGRFDYGMLYYFPQTWTSDNTDGLDRQEIQYGASYLFHPYQMTGHVSTTPNHQTQRQTPSHTRINLASSTNMGYELNILNYNECDVLLTSKHIEQYKKDRILIKNSKFFRLYSPFESNNCIWLFENEEQTCYILIAFRNRFSVTDHHHIIKIPYLNPNKNYYIEEYNITISGSELIYSGLHLSFDRKDWDSISLHLYLIK